MKSLETRKKLSESLKAKWASGTRKQNPPETYTKASATHRKAIAEGKRKFRALSSEDAKKMASMVDIEKVIAANRRTAQARIGAENPPGLSAKGPGHFKAKYWILKSPDNFTVQGKNLNHIIRENPHLFDPKDIVWHKSSCLAARGLRRLREIKKSTGRPAALSWRGWVLVDSFDDRLDKG